MEKLRDLVQNQSITIALHNCLSYTSKNHQDMNHVGTIWVDENIFLFNVHIFANFIGKKADTIKHNLKDHGFLTVPMTIKEKYRKFEMLNTDPSFIKSWVARKHPYYCISSDEKVVHSFRFQHNKKSNISFQKEHNSIENIHFEDIECYNDNCNDDDFFIIDEIETSNDHFKFNIDL